MTVIVNGKPVEIEVGATVGTLLKKLRVGLAGTAVEVNREIVPKRIIDETPLTDGDTVEVIRMVGGG